MTVVNRSSTVAMGTPPSRADHASISSRRDPRRRADRTVERQRQADHHTDRFLLGHGPSQGPAVGGPVAAPGNHAEGTRHQLMAVGYGDTDPDRAQIDAQHPAPGRDQRSSPRVWRTSPRASSRRLGSRPPAIATSGFLPPPPPDDLGRLGDQVRCHQAGVLGDRRHQRHLAVVGAAAEDDGTYPGLAAHAEREFLELALVEPVAAGDHGAAIVGRGSRPTPGPGHAGPLGGHSSARPGSPATRPAVVRWRAATRRGWPSATAPPAR